MKLYTGGYLSFYMPERRNTLDIPLQTPRPLTDLLEELHIPLAEVHLVAINGDQVVDLAGAIIQDTDIVRIFSSVNGG